jgi:hypothetical protein
MSDEQLLRTGRLSRLCAVCIELCTVRFELLTLRHCQRRVRVRRLLSRFVVQHNAPRAGSGAERRLEQQEKEDLRGAAGEFD